MMRAYLPALPIDGIEHWRRARHWLGCQGLLGLLLLSCWSGMLVARPSAPTGLVARQAIVVHREGAGAELAVTVGIPFAPGVLFDPARLRILDEHGEELPSAAEVSLRWYARDQSIRALRVQFRLPFQGPSRTVYFAYDRPRLRSLVGWPYADGLLTGAQGEPRMPAALATLSADWLCASLIAGPQAPVAPDEAYARYVEAQFAWAGALPVDDPSAWLFDRPSTLFKAYVRSGRADYLRAAEQSYRFYMSHIRREGPPFSPICAGGWDFGGKPCDVKYVYVEPILLALALTGDDSQHDAALVDKMMSLWENGGWNERPGPYREPSQHFTERMAGLGLLETVSAYELTGDRRYLARLQARVGWLLEQQRNNPDGLGNDGSWRSSWQRHEDDSWRPQTDVRGSSPWMSENIIDGLWHAWLVTADPRIPPMITGFGRYLEQHGWITPAQLAQGHDWRHPCSGANGQIAWYWSSAHASETVLAKIEDNDGWYSDAHTVELGLPVALARYFETDPQQAAALGHRLDALRPSYDTACALTSETRRRFNWNNRGSGVVPWLARQPAGAGARGGGLAGKSP